jgi:aminoacrylate hydrolase
MYQQAGPELHALFHPLWLYPPDYVNAHDAEIEAERGRSAAGAPPVEVSVGRISALLAFDRRAGLPGIKAPTLIVASDNDYITPCYHAEAIARAIPNARLVILRGGGHSISRTRAEEFNRLVLEFLEPGDR